MAGGGGGRGGGGRAGAGAVAAGDPGPAGALRVAAGTSKAERAAIAARAEELELAELAELAELTAIVDGVDRKTEAVGTGEARGDRGRGREENGLWNGLADGSPEGTSEGSPEGSGASTGEDSERGGEENVLDSNAENLGGPEEAAGRVDEAVAMGDDGEGTETEDDENKGDGRALAARLADADIILRPPARAAPARRRRRAGAAAALTQEKDRRRRVARGAAGAAAREGGAGDARGVAGGLGAGGLTSGHGAGAGSGARADEPEVGLLKGEAESRTPRWREDAVEGNHDYVTDEEPPYHLRVEERRRAAAAAAAIASATELVDPHAQRHLMISLMMQPLDCPVVDDVSESGSDGPGEGTAVVQSVARPVLDGGGGGAEGALDGAGVTCAEGEDFRGKGCVDRTGEVFVAGGGVDTGVGAVGAAVGVGAVSMDAGLDRAVIASAASQNQDGVSAALPAAFVRRPAQAAVPVSRRRLLAISRFRARHKRLPIPMLTFGYRAKRRRAETGPLLWKTCPDARELPFAPPNPFANVFHLQRLVAIRAFHRRCGSVITKQAVGKKTSASQAAAWPPPHLTIWAFDTKRVMCTCISCAPKSAGAATHIGNGLSGKDQLECTLPVLSLSIDV